LDVETLEALESRLRQYQGTLLVVSHDRHFLDRVVTSTLVFEGDGLVRRYAGGYSDWVRLQHSLATEDELAVTAARGSQSAPDNNAAPAAPRKLSYKLQRELDSLPDAIEQLETAIGELASAVNDPSLYQLHSQEEIQTKFSELEGLRKALDVKMARWEDLEAERLTAQKRH
jgi:ATP-binding cassette subfamily F protein uup